MQNLSYKVHSKKQIEIQYYCWEPKN